jgi:hypothetical protein
MFPSRSDHLLIDRVWMAYDCNGNHFFLCVLIEELDLLESEYRHVSRVERDVTRPTRLNRCHELGGRNCCS